MLDVAHRLSKRDKVSDRRESGLDPVTNASRDEGVFPHFVDSFSTGFV